MKASAIYVFLITGTLAAVGNVDITAREPDASSLCGELGVMTVNTSELPSNVAPGDVRMCAKHPQGRDRTLDISEGASLAPAYVNEYGTADNASMSSMHV
ncbi:hypothetical protein Trco_005610 [Trichoderma cornu-damae]|uniref:SSCRP protein n=1 Tax=Trichoderma cornu-damae TaxID=654480 RepID=A0A9P8TVX1_9HYPO|nr:hypothetical protein Trco_005610 [Trichoderma cornu-damae]